VERIRAENRYRNQQDVLIDRVLGPNLRANSSLEIRPTDRPDDFVPYEVDVESAVSQAFEYRPELAAALHELERREVQQSFARNQMLPELDGLFGFGQGDLAGRVNPDFNPAFGAPDPRFIGGFDDSVDDFDDFPQYRAGARISIPFPNRTARSNASISELEYARSRTSLRRLEQQIIIEVRQAARNLLASQEGISAARAAREAAQEQLRAEEIRLEYGESTPFDVLQREEDLVERERQEIEAFQAYRSSVTALDRAQGTILRNRNIQIADVAPLR
jgi:outer membrane protein TolC